MKFLHQNPKNTKKAFKFTTVFLLINLRERKISCVKPTIESKGIHQILITESIADGLEKPLFEWLDGKLPKELSFIGNIPLTTDLA